MAEIDTSKFLNQWTTQKVSYLTRDLLTYAVGIGCTDLNFVYENNKGFDLKKIFSRGIFFQIRLHQTEAVILF